MANRDEVIIPKHIIWAVDPYIEDKSLQKNAITLLAELSKLTATVIEPTFLVSTHTGNSLELNTDLFQKIKIGAQEKLDRLLGSQKNFAPLKLTLIYEPFLTRRQGIRKLIDYAKERQCDLIVLSTHARKGAKHWFQGSFAENLIFESEVPFLSVNPNYKQRDYFKRILFPTDFGPVSEEAFHRVLRWAKLLNSEITLFHRIQATIIPNFEISWIDNPVYEQSLEDEKKKVFKESEVWISEAKRAGIKSKLVLDSSPTLLGLDEAILKYTKKNPSIIAMASESSAISTLLLGSTTRKILRSSPYPVWVMHPKEKILRNLQRFQSVSA